MQAVDELVDSVGVVFHTNAFRHRLAGSASTSAAGCQQSSLPLVVPIHAFSAGPTRCTAHCHAATAQLTRDIRVRTVAMAVRGGGAAALLDEPRSAAPRSITDDQAASVIATTVEPIPRNTMQRSVARQLLRPVYALDPERVRPATGSY